MKKKYIIDIAINSLFRSKFVTVIEIICLTIGMVIPFFFIAQFNNGYYEAKKNANSYITKDLVMLKPDYGGDALPISTSDLLMFTQDNGVKGIYYVNEMNQESIFIHNRIAIGYKVFLVDKEFHNILRNNWILDGNYIQKNYECVIGSKLAKKENINIKDSIKINDKEYTVVGINQIPNYEKSIIISQSPTVEYELYDAVYFIKIDEGMIKHREKIVNYVLSKYGTYNFYYADEINSLFYKKLSSGWGITILISLVSLIYTLVNIYNIMRFYTIKYRKKIAISLAFGSTKGQIYLQKYVEISVVSIISSLFTYLILSCIENSSIQYILSIKVDIYILMAILFLGQIVAFIFSTLLVKSILQKPIAEIIKG